MFFNVTCVEYFRWLGNVAILVKCSFSFRGLQCVGNRSERRTAERE